MNIDGIDLDWVPMDAAYARLDSGFTVADLENAFLQGGLDPTVAGRAASRYLQSMRKRGRVIYRRKQWLKLRPHRALSG